MISTSSIRRISINSIRRMKKNGFQHNNGAKCVQIFALAMFLMGLDLQAIHSQNDFQPDFGLEQPLVQMTLFKLDAQSSLQEYQMLSKKIGIRLEEKLVILILVIQNLVDIPVETPLRDIVPITGSTRHLFFAYLVEDAKTGRPAYTLPVWNTVPRVPPKGTLTIRLAFVVQHGAHGAFEDALRVFACFSHEILGGVCKSLAWSGLTPKETIQKPLEQASSTEVSKDGVVEHPPVVGFDISESVNPEAVRLLRFPTTPLEGAGPSLFVEYFLGARGKNNTYPYWFDLCRAAADGKLDYPTILRYLYVLHVYKSAEPSGLARNAVWLEDIGILMTPTKHRVYIASSVWGVCSLPHGAAEVLLYLASEALTIGLDPTDLVPIPRSYKPLTDNGRNGFELRFSGVSLKAFSTGVGYEITLQKPAGTENQVETQSLTYIRRTTAVE